METGNVSDTKCLHYLVNTMPGAVAFFPLLFWSINEWYWANLLNESLSKITLGRWPSFTHLLGRFTSQTILDVAQLQWKQSFWATQWLFMSIQQKLYMRCELVRLLGSLPPHCSPHTSVWCGAHSSSHNHPPATNKHLGVGAGAGEGWGRLLPETFPQ